MKSPLPEDFAKDSPWPRLSLPSPVAFASQRIEGLIVQPLLPNADGRGSLFELLTTRDSAVDPIVHVYAVNAAAGSERGLVYHAKQSDRLAFVQGRFRIILMDVREDSPTYGAKLCFEAGEAAPVRVTIPPFVAHGVKNVGDSASMFINMPTRPFYRDDPDKFRVKLEKYRDIIDFDTPADF